MRRVPTSLAVLAAALALWTPVTEAALAAGSPQSMRAAGADGGSQTASASQGARRIQGSDWQLAMWKIAQVRATMPTVPVVYLLGGSSARECTVGDDEWAEEIAALGGPEVITVNLGTRNQTFGQELQIVKSLPRNVPSIVLIGVNQGRYAMGQMDSRLQLPDPASPQPPGTQHHYSSGKVYSLAKKKSLVKAWMKTPYMRFRSRYAGNFATLEKVVAKCTERGLHPVLVDLPRLTSVIGHAWDVPITRYHKGCRALKSEYGTPFYNFVRASAFVPEDFFDLVHLVEPGRVKFQRQLSRVTIALLKKYGMTPSVVPEEEPGQNAI